VFRGQIRTRGVPNEGSGTAPTRSSGLHDELLGAPHGVVRGRARHQDTPVSRPTAASTARIAVNRHAPTPVLGRAVEGGGADGAPRVEGVTGLSEPKASAAGAQQGREQG